MTQTEQDALRDLLANARHARQAAERLPKDAPGCGIGSARFRLLLGALDCERAAAFIYWRNEQNKT